MLAGFLVWRRRRIGSGVLGGLGGALRNRCQCTGEVKLDGIFGILLVYWGSEARLGLIVYS